MLPWGSQTLFKSFKGRLLPLPDWRVNICSVPHSHESPLRTPLRGHTSEIRTLIQWRIWNRIDLPWFPSSHTSRWNGKLAGCEDTWGLGNSNGQGVTITPCELPSLLPPWLLLLYLLLKWDFSISAVTINHTPKISHPYFHWYFYQNTSVCMH